MPLIVLDGVSKRYQPGGPPAVDALSLSVNQGEILALLGPSGCGKTTTLRLIIGFETPDAGRIEIAGRVVADGRRALPPESRGIGMVFQDYALFPHLTAAQNIAFGIKKLPAVERARRTQHVLALTEMQGLEKRYPHELSGGQQQRVALARALAPGYQIMLLDEPLSNLDADLRVQLRAQLRRLLKCTEQTAIVVTHDQDEAFEIADRVGILHEGRLEQAGTPEELYHTPATRFVARFLGGSSFLPGTVEPDGIHTVLGIVPNPNGVAVGAPAEVWIRPDEITLILDPDGQGVITDRRFRGSDYLYSVCLCPHLEIRSTQPSTRILPLGSRVAVKLTASRLVVFPSSKS